MPKVCWKALMWIPIWKSLSIWITTQRGVWNGNSKVIRFCRMVWWVFSNTASYSGNNGIWWRLHTRFWIFCSACLSWFVFLGMSNHKRLQMQQQQGAAAAVTDAVIDPCRTIMRKRQRNLLPEEPRKGYVPWSQWSIKWTKIGHLKQSWWPLLYACSIPNGMNPSQAPTGGYLPTSNGGLFFGDQKSSKVGDILTI